MAAAGFLTLAFDPSFTGESGGFPRNVASPDINTEDFQAAIDYLSNLELADPGKTRDRRDLWLGWYGFECCCP